MVHMFAVGLLAYTHLSPIQPFKTGINKKACSPPLAEHVHIHVHVHVCE